MSEGFSLLMSVYMGDRADYFEAAFRSVVHDQTRRPDDVVLVQDGPVSKRLEAKIAEMVASSPVPTQLITFAANQGLGPALDAGMRICRHDIVARMDADDISLAERFAVQVPVVEAGADLVGSALLEFERDPATPTVKRTPPLDPAEIVRYARFHQPFNHPTIVYRRALVEAVGGYTGLPLMEDYLLFARMIHHGASVANVADALVLYRVGDGAYDRRGGVTLLKSEWRLQRRLRAQGFTSRWQFTRNMVVRGGYRLVPVGIRRAAYRRWIAPHGER